MCIHLKVKQRKQLRTFEMSATGLKTLQQVIEARKHSPKPSAFVDEMWSGKIMIKHLNAY